MGYITVGWAPRAHAVIRDIGYAVPVLADVERVGTACPPYERIFTN
jgi:hypothetical protein